MQKREKYVTGFDLRLLSELFGGTRLWSKKDREYLINTGEELEQADVVPSHYIPADVLARRLRVGQALYRPEAAGDDHL
jgi:hypothetical protein